MTAAAASRDVALFHAMALLHQANYGASRFYFFVVADFRVCTQKASLADLGQAVKYLVPPPQKENYPLDADKSTGHNTVRLGGPILCRDQLEEWSAAEATLFEEASRVAESSRAEPTRDGEALDFVLASSIAVCNRLF